LNLIHMTNVVSLNGYVKNSAPHLDRNDIYAESELLSFCFGINEGVPSFPPAKVHWKKGLARADCPSKILSSG